MKQFFITIDNFDKKIYKDLNKISSKNLDIFIAIFAINPLLLYIFLLSINIFYFNNLYINYFIYSIIGWVFILCLKHLIKRQRPQIIKGSFYHEIFRLKPDNYSFPSVHTFISFELIPISFRFSFWLGLIISLYAITISFSRYYLRFHYFSDIVSATVFGLILGFLTA